MTFGQYFLRIYDRKIASGEISFSRSGINANDFTRLCIDPEFAFSEEAIERVTEKMHLTEEEHDQLLKLAGLI